MEVYENVSDPAQFERLLHQALDEFDVGLFIDGARKQECFVGTAPAVACTPRSGG